MSVLVIGLSHLTAPLEVLESVTLTGDDVAKTLDELTAAPCIDEALVLATCNRVEVYADVTMFHPAVAEISSVLARRAGLTVAELGRHLYVHYAAPAVQHIFRVSAGLDSMVVGESQILGQLRDAYATAVAGGAVGTVLHDLAQRSLHVGKRVHSETAIDHAGASVVSVALDRAPSLQDASVAVVGAGAMGALAAATAMRRGAGRITVVNRGVARAQRLAAAVDGRAARLDDLAQVVADADVLVSSTGAVGTVVDVDLVGDRSARPLLVLDLAVPRDVSPAVGKLPGVTLFDLASLRVTDGAVVADADIAAADAIVTTELDTYLSAQRQLAVTPTVTALRARAGEVVAAEIARLDGRLPSMDERTRTEVNTAVRRAVEKLLHVPTVRVKELAAAADGADYTAALRALFDLDPASAESVVAVRDDTTGSRAVGGAATAAGTSATGMSATGMSATGTSAQGTSAQGTSASGAALAGVVGVTAVRTVRVGTRNSLLARTQTDHVVRALREATHGELEVEIVPIVTEGDVSRAALAQIGGTGVFVASLRTALLEQRIDLAVHSYKDLPTLPAAGLAIGAVPPRADPRDALVARDGLTLGGLPEGSRIGTGSPRRAAQLRALGLGLVVEPIRGNVDTRMAAVSEGRLDAVVLAAAGLRRLGRIDEATEVLDPTQLLPAPAQGALAVEIRTGDDAVAGLVAALDDRSSRAAVLAERAVLAALEAGCSAPVGALADVADGEPGQPDELYLRASVTAADGSDAVRLSATGPLTDAEDIGRRLAAELIDLGADTMMGSST